MSLVILWKCIYVRGFSCAPLFLLFVCCLVWFGFLAMQAWPDGYNLCLVDGQLKNIFGIRYFMSWLTREGLHLCASTPPMFHLRASEMFVWAKSWHWTGGGPCLSYLSGGLKEDFVSFLCSGHQSKGLQGAVLQAALEFSENFRAFPFLSQ